MFGAVIITAVITGLLIFVVALRNYTKEKIDELQLLRRENAHLQRELKYHLRTQQLEKEKNAYERGAYEARETDVVYRQLLKQVQKREHVTVMLGGSKDIKEAE